MVQKVLQPFGARIRWFIEGPINGSHRYLGTVSRRADSFNRWPKNKERGGVIGTPAALHRIQPDAYFALAVIQASLWAVHSTAFLSNCW
jgi:hypothetical protein